MNSRSRQTFFATAAALLSPLTLFTLVVIIEPLGLLDVLGFWKTFSISNTTTAPVWVTPIGAIDKAGVRKTLPYSRKQNTFPRKQDREFPIPPGSVHTFVYDWDDIQFSEILVRMNGAPHRFLPTGLHPTEIQFQAPKQSHFVIGDFQALAWAEPVHLQALEQAKSYRMQIFNGLAVLGLLSPVFFVLALRETRIITSRRPAERNDAAPRRIA